MSVAINYELPAVKGVQAGRECYVAMVPMDVIPKLFPYPPHQKSESQG